MRPPEVTSGRAACFLFLRPSMAPGASLTSRQHLLLQADPMTASFVGTPALAAAASSNSMSVTGVWGAGQNRTAPHLLVAVISAFGPTSVTLGTPPAGWALYQTEPSGATLTTVTYTKIATGGDSAPVFTATTVGGAGSSALTCTLFECADSGGLTPVIQASG